MTFPRCGLLPVNNIITGNSSYWLRPQCTRGEKNMLMKEEQFAEIRYKGHKLHFEGIAAALPEELEMQLVKRVLLN